MKNTGKIIVLAYPDTFVTMSTEWVCKVLPFFGLGTKEYIKAGHAALVLIDNKTGSARYFDFGRYVTPSGHGRVRGANTDVELTIPISAKLSAHKELLNLDEFLLWLDANPQKTHGEGRLLASVCNAVNFNKADRFIQKLQQRGSIPYGAFNKGGSNCARFVTDTIVEATTDSSIRKALLRNKSFTPSTVGTVEKVTNKNEVFEILSGTIKRYNGSALKENLTNYFHRKPTTNTIAVSEAIEVAAPSTAQKLSGTGSNAWFELTEKSMPMHHYNIKRYNDLGQVDFNGVYVSALFNRSKPYKFTYDSHCGYCHVIQDDKKIKLNCIGSVANFNSLRKQRSA